MSTAKKVLLVIVIIIALPFIIALFVKKDYAVEKTVVINRPKAEVFDYVKHIKNQDHYSVWNMMDPDMKTEDRGTDGTVGFVNYWNSEEAGEGEQEIKNIEEGSRVDMELRFKRPFESTGHAYMTTADAGAGSTTVSWGMHGENPYPMNFMNLFMDGMLGSDIETGLNNMKANLEKQ